MTDNLGKRLRPLFEGEMGRAVDVLESGVGERLGVGAAGIFGLQVVGAVDDEHVLLFFRHRDLNLGHVGGRIIPGLGPLDVDLAGCSGNAVAVLFDP